MDALLKFGPQRSALADALRAAQQTYGSTVRAGNATALLTQRAAARAQPQIAAIYSGADAATKAGQTLVSQQLAQLPGVADQYKANQASEVSQTLANLASARAGDEGMLAQQGVSARAGAQFNQTQARGALQQAVSQLISKGQSLSAEQGAFSAAEAQKLAHEAESNEQQERASERTAATSRANSKEGTAQQEAASKRSAAAKGAGYVNGVKLQSSSAQQKAADTIGQIRGLAGAILREGHSRADALHLLTQEEPSISKSVSERDKNGKPTGVSRSTTIPARKAYAPDALMAAALDEAQFGGVTPATVRRLHAAGYSVKQLGVKVTRGPGPSIQRGLGSTIHAAVKAISGV